MSSLFRKGHVETPSTAGGAAILLLVITIIMIFYILFLPPADRESLLSDGPIPGSGSGTPGNGYTSHIGDTVLRENVGKVGYTKDNIITHELSSFQIYTQTDATLVKEQAALYAKNSAFGRRFIELPFNVEKSATENLYLSFNVLHGEGILKIYFNGVAIFEGGLLEGTPAPIALPKDLIKNDNMLYFTVSSPGFAFWRVNEYELQNIRITGDVTDDSNSFNVQKVYLAESEFKKMQEATFQFYPDCINGNVGRITVAINGKLAFHGTPDCAIKNFVTVDDSTLQQGENEIEFVSEKGSYIIDQVEMEVKLEEAEYPIYYFDLSDELFVNTENTDNFCGKIDGVCPNNCEKFEDKDCCFSNSRNNYWCDMRTENPQDRCVNIVLAENGERCESGYEDRSGDPHGELEGECGDDTDGNCPHGCSKYFDKDCCYEDDSNNYWCEDIPFTGVDSVCTRYVSPSECDACPDGFEDEDGDRPNCAYEPSNNDFEELELRDELQLIIEIRFVDREYKKVDFNINGNTIPVDTYNLLVTRDISPYVNEGTNSIQIIPRKDVEIAEIKVKID